MLTSFPINVSSNFKRQFHNTLSILNTCLIHANSVHWRVQVARTVAALEPPYRPDLQSAVSANAIIVVNISCAELDSVER